MSEYKEIFAHRDAQNTAKRRETIKKIIVVLLKILCALGAIVGLEAITFISGTFAVILVAVAVCVGTFNIGYIWNEIKY